MWRSARHCWSGLTRLVATLALFAMVVRAVVPLGYMVSSHGAESLRVTFCSGQAAQLDLTTGTLAPTDRRAPAEREGHDAPCVFAGLSALAPPTAPPTLPASIAIGRAPPLAPVAPRIGRGLAAPPPWATGPPLSA